MNLEVTGQAFAKVNAMQQCNAIK